MKSPASGHAKHGRKYHQQNVGRVDSTQFMNTYGFHVNLPYIPAEILEKYLIVVKMWKLEDKPQKMMNQELPN